MGDAEEYDGNGFASVSLGDEKAPEGKQLQLTDKVEQAPEGFPSSGGKGETDGAASDGTKASRRCMNPVAAVKWFAANNFIMKIQRVIGWRFIIVTVMLYGFDQGGIENLDGIAAPFWFKERGYQPAQAERALAWAGFSWEVKPVYGLIMDTLPLFGWHYKPYLFTLGLIGGASYLTIAIKKTIDYGSMIALLFFGTVTRNTIYASVSNAYEVHTHTYTRDSCTVWQITRPRAPLSSIHIYIHTHTQRRDVSYSFTMCNNNDDEQYLCKTFKILGQSRPAAGKA